MKANIKNLLLILGFRQITPVTAARTFPKGTKLTQLPVYINLTAKPKFKQNNKPLTCEITMTFSDLDKLNTALQTGPCIVKITSAQQNQAKNSFYSAKIEAKQNNIQIFSRTVSPLISQSGRTPKVNIYSLKNITFKKI